MSITLWVVHRCGLCIVLSSLDFPNIFTSQNYFFYSKNHAFAYKRRRYQNFNVCKKLPKFRSFCKFWHFGKFSSFGIYSLCAQKASILTTLKQKASILTTLKFMHECGFLKIDPRQIRIIIPLMSTVLAALGRIWSKLSCTLYKYTICISNRVVSRYTDRS